MNRKNEVLVTNLFDKIADSRHHSVNPCRELQVGLYGIPVEAVHALLHLIHQGVEIVVKSIVNT